MGEVGKVGGQCRSERDRHGRRAAAASNSVTTAAAASVAANTAVCRGGRHDGRRKQRQKHCRVLTGWPCAGAAASQYPVVPVLAMSPALSSTITTRTRAASWPSVCAAATPLCCRRCVCPAPGLLRCRLETVLVLLLLLPGTLLTALPYYPTATARPQRPVGAATTPFCCPHCPQRYDVIKRQNERRGRDCQTGTWTLPSWTAR